MIDEEKQVTDNEELQDEEIDLDSITQLVEEELNSSEDKAPKEAGATAGKADEGTTASEPGAESNKVSELMSEIIALKRQLEERNSQYTRLYADFDNFRKRTEREKEEQEDRIGAKLLKKFLPVVDDFERAQSQIKPKTDAEATIHNSYQSVYKQLVKSLKEAGVLRMKAVGQEFDPNYHEAITQEETSEFDEGVVSSDLRPGYLLGDRVLRHAMVKVATAPAGNNLKDAAELEDTEKIAENAINNPGVDK